MKTIVLLFGLALLWPVLVSATTETNPAADAAWAELQEPGLFEYREPPNFTTLSRRERLLRVEAQAQLLREKGMAFMAAYPTDPRRWRVGFRLLERVPLFIMGFGPNFDTDLRDIVIDIAAATAWRQTLKKLASTMDAAPDLPPDLREPLDFYRLRQLIAPPSGLGIPPESDWSAVAPAVMAFAQKYPEHPRLQMTVRNIMYRFEARSRPFESLQAWREFVAVPHAPLAEMAREKVRALSAIAGEIDLRFTALDGREVDLRQLRGKVVLIDFWATWCGPCLAEMPNVKKVYAAFRDHGFEVIGVSCDFAPENSGKYRTTAAKTGSEVMEFCRLNDMPWPQYYDGHKHNEGGNLLAQRFAVTGIPATFLIDQTGQVVALNLKGEKLDAEVRRLLKL